MVREVCKLIAVLVLDHASLSLVLLKNIVNQGLCCVLTNVLLLPEGIFSKLVVTHACAVPSLFLHRSPASVSL